MYIVVDDLRPNLNKAYGHGFMVTPNLDELADKSLTFRAAYCQYACVRLGPTKCPKPAVFFCLGWPL